MLFVLTGQVQTGKTRWLEDVLDELAAEGVPAYGVTAPGVWVPSAGSEADSNGFEKLGIDQVLLPGGERIGFARRRDLAQADGAYDAASQSARAQLAWAIDDAALAQVNAHLASLEFRVGEDAPGLLVIDELGRLELERDGGLTEALALLARGSLPSWPHSLVVARARLAEVVSARFGSLWGGAQLIAPSDEGRATLRAALS